MKTVLEKLLVTSFYIIAVARTENSNCSTSCAGLTEGVQERNITYHHSKYESSILWNRQMKEQFTERFGHLSRYLNFFSSAFVKDTRTGIYSKLF